MSCSIEVKQKGTDSIDLSMTTVFEQVSHLSTKGSSFCNWSDKATNVSRVPTYK